MKFRFAGYIPNSMENGEGIRDVIFFSGCKRNCDGCHNKELQDFSFGEDVEVDEIINLIKENKDFIDGVTISGGDPVYQYDALLELCKKLKQENVNVWVYTGATIEEILNEYGKELLEYIDVLVDGPFIKKLHDTSLRYRGSSNQRIIYEENFMEFNNDLNNKKF